MNFIHGVKVVAIALLVVLAIMLIGVVLGLA